jgi:hypothetical protein
MINKSEQDQLRVYVFCDDLICKLATSEPCDVNYSEKKTPVIFTLEEYHETLHLYTEYLLCYLNKGYYNHMAGANYVVLSRLKMGVHLTYLVFNSEIEGTKCFSKYIEAWKDIECKEKSEVIEKLIIWLLLNNPTSKGKSDPCSMNHNRITKVIMEKICDLIPKNKELVSILLPKIMKQVIDFDNMILTNCDKLGVERSSSLQKNCNSIFRSCLHDKEIFNHLLVKMKGFNFFLQRLFSKNEEVNGTENEESKEEIIGEENDSHSDEEETKIDDLFQDFQVKVKSSLKPDTEKKDQNKEKKGIDKVNLVDAGKTMKLIESSLGVENTSQDWIMYKNGQRNRILYKHIDKSSGPDFIMRFELTDVIEVSDIQMGLIYYWGNYDADMHYEPMSVFCEGGMTKDQIDWSIKLRLADDGGYRQSAVNVYGANFSHFKSMNSDVDLYNEDPYLLINHKIKGISDIYKAKYITFRLRRPEICCLESSMFSTVLTKTMSYGFTFFSVQGIYPSHYLSLKTALTDACKENTLEILSEFCSGNLSETFGIIANDKEVINGFKSSISKLSKLLDQKEYLIKPILIALCSENSEMANWIIDKFLDLKANEKQVGLIGEIIERDKTKPIDRIIKLLDFIFLNIDSDKVKTMKNLKYFIEIFISNSYKFTDSVEEEVKIKYDIKLIDVILDKTID